MVTELGEPRSARTSSRAASPCGHSRLTSSRMRHSYVALTRFQRSAVHSREKGHTPGGKQCMAIDIWRTRRLMGTPLGRVVDRLFNESLTPFYGGRDGGGG